MAAVPNCETFNIQKAGQLEYRLFIQKVRNELGKISNKKSHGLPVLPDQEKIPTKWVDIILQNNNSSAVKLRVRVENLYLDGYQTQNKTGEFDEWFEFKHEPPRTLIPGSTTLPFDGSYRQLLRAANIKDLESVLIGKQEAMNGITSLNDVNSKDSKIIAEVLIVFIQIICESSRFKLISDYIGPTFSSNGRSVKLDTRKVNIEHSWGTLSEALLKMDTDPNYEFPPQPQIQICTYFEAVEILGILLGGKAKATVLVTFAVGDRATVRKVYGLIESQYEDIMSVLFRKEANEFVDVTPGQVITLSESVLDNVPFVSPHVVLKSELRAENNQVIARDHAEFPVQLSGAFEKLIPCEHGEICVKVTWF